MNQTYKTVLIENDNNIVTVKLNRPDLHNAMNDVMIAELTNIFLKLSNSDSVRVVVIRGEGKSFCAGADLNYMKGIAGFGFEENVQDGKKLAALFSAVYKCSLPTIAMVHGAAFGGANGLLAACDIVIAEENTTFAFSEVKIGIAPATISPFVVKRIGEFGSKELMMTGKRFKGQEAEKWHLVNRSVPKEKMDETLQEYIKQFLSAAPEAVKVTKNMIGEVMTSNDFDETISSMAHLIATLRASREGQEGMSAFLEKRKPKWEEK